MTSQEVLAFTEALRGVDTLTVSASLKSLAELGCDGASKGWAHLALSPVCEQRSSAFGWPLRRLPSTWAPFSVRNGLL